LLTELFLPGCHQEKNGDHIRRVLQEHAVLEAHFAEKAGTWGFIWDQSESVGHYVSGLRQIDLKRCPEDFQEAFRNDIQACAMYQEVARSYGGVNGMVKGFLTAGLAAIDAYSSGEASLQEIHLTWNEVLRIAGKYHAIVSE